MKRGRPKKKPRPGHISDESRARAKHLDLHPQDAEPGEIERLAEEFLFGTIRRQGRPIKDLSGILTEHRGETIASNERAFGSSADMCLAKPSIHSTEGELIR